MPACKQRGEVRLLDGFKGQGKCIGRIGAPVGVLSGVGQVEPQEEGVALFGCELLKRPVAPLTRLHAHQNQKGDLLAQKGV